MSPSHNPTTLPSDPVPLTPAAELPPALAPNLIPFRERVWTVPPEMIPDVTPLVIDDGAPVDSQFAEKQQRLLADTLWTSWAGAGDGRPFGAWANVGLFFKYGAEPLVPDVMVGLGDQPGEDLSQKENNSYFVWHVGKPPNLVIELVSDLRGKEDTKKLVRYAAIGVTYYVIYDPKQKLGGAVLEAYSVQDGIYHLLEKPWFPSIKLGLKRWEGVYQGGKASWLRWCDEAGNLIPTGKERADAEKLRADAEKLRADALAKQVEEVTTKNARLLARLRELGVDPEA